MTRWVRSPCAHGSTLWASRAETVLNDQSALGDRGSRNPPTHPLACGNNSTVSSLLGGSGGRRRARAIIRRRQAGATTGPLSHQITSWKSEQPLSCFHHKVGFMLAFPDLGGHVSTKTTSPWSLKNFRFLERFKDTKAKGGVPLLCCGGIEAPTGSSVLLRGCPSLRRHADELRDDGPLNKAWTEVTLSIRHYPLPSVNHF